MRKILIPMSLAVTSVTLSLGISSQAHAVQGDGIHCGTARVMGPSTKLQACIERSGNWVRLRSVMINKGELYEKMWTKDLKLTRVISDGDPDITMQCSTNSGWVSLPPVYSTLGGNVKTCVTEWREFFTGTEGNAGFMEGEVTAQDWRTGVTYTARTPRAPQS